MTRTLMIGGSGRSGTTVLCRAVGRHPDVTDVPEWRFTTDPDGIVDFYTQCVAGLNSPFHVDLRLKRLGTLLDAVATRGPVDAVLGSSQARAFAAKTHRNLAPAYARTDAVTYSPNFRQFAARLVERLTTFSYPGYWVGMPAFSEARIAFSDADREEVRAACQEFLDSVAADVAAAQGARVHLEKNTWNILCWDRTREVLPDARLVHIVRDPRDVISSYSEQSWVPTDVTQAARILAAIMGTWQEIRERVPADSYHELRLEDLTADPEGGYRELCAFWDIPWSDRLLDTKLTNASFGRWRTDLTADQVAAVTPILSPVIEQYGYA